MNPWLKIALLDAALAVLGTTAVAVLIVSLPAQAQQQAPAQPVLLIGASYYATSPQTLGVFSDFNACSVASRSIEARSRDWTGRQLAAMCVPAAGLIVNTTP